MKARYIGLILVAWMLLIAGIALSRHSSSPHSGTRLTVPPGATVATPTTTSSGSSPTPSFTGPGSGSTTPEAPATTPGTSVPPATPAPSVSGPTQQQNIAVSGWPAVAAMPYSNKLIRVSLDVFAANTPHVSVYYNTTLAAGKRAFVRFVRANHDRPDHYAVRYFPRSVVKQQAQQQSQMDLAFSGYKLIVRLPDHYGKTTLTFAGKQGRSVLIGYTGPRARALQRLRYWVKVYDDHISHYTLVKR